MRREVRRCGLGSALRLMLLGAALAASLAVAPGRADAATRELRRTSTGEPSTLDPQLWTYGQDGNLAQDLFQGLTTLDAAARPVPGQAESWSVSPDGRRYSFRLRSGLVWSDGTPMDSGDFLWSFRRLFDPRTAAPSASLLYVIRNARAVNTGKLPPAQLGVLAPDPRTVVIELDTPAPYLLDLLVHRAFPVPRHVVEKWGREWTRPGRIVSNGAFVLGEWRPGSHVRLDRNPRFHEVAGVRLDAVYHVPVEDPGAALRRYRAGELDVVVSLPSEQIPTLRREYGTQLHLVQQMGIEYLAFNTRRPPFDDARVRRALSMAVDREILAAKILQAGEPAAFCLVPPGVVNYPAPGCADFGAWSQARRVEEARRLLESAGFGTRRPLALRLRFANSETQRRLALAMAAMWQPLGVRPAGRRRPQGAPAGRAAGRLRRRARRLVRGGPRPAVVPRTARQPGRGAEHLALRGPRATMRCSIARRRASSPERAPRCSPRPSGVPWRCSRWLRSTCTCHGA